MVPDLYGCCEDLKEKMQKLGTVMGTIVNAIQMAAIIQERSTLVELRTEEGNKIDFPYLPCHRENLGPSWASFLPGKREWQSY